jgi:hypothetical protein
MDTREFSSASESDSADGDADYHPNAPRGYRPAPRAKRQRRGAAATDPSPSADRHALPGVAPGQANAATSRSDDDHQVQAPCTFPRAAALGIVKGHLMRDGAGGGFLKAMVDANRRVDALKMCFLALSTIHHQLAIANQLVARIKRAKAEAALAEWIPMAMQLYRLGRFQIDEAACGAALVELLYTDGRHTLRQLEVAPLPCATCALFGATGLAPPPCECPPRPPNPEIERIRQDAWMGAVAQEVCLDKLTLDTSELGALLSVLALLDTCLAQSALGTQRDWTATADKGVALRRLSDLDATAGFDASVHFPAVQTVYLRLVGFGVSDLAQEETAVLHAGLLSFSPGRQPPAFQLKAWQKRDGVVLPLVGRGGRQSVALQFHTADRSASAQLGRVAAYAQIDGVAGIDWVYPSAATTCVVYAIPAGGVSLDSWLDLSPPPNLARRLRVARDLAALVEKLKAVGVFVDVDAACAFVVDADGPAERLVIVDGGTFGFDGRYARACAHSLWLTIGTVLDPPVNEANTQRELAVAGATSDLLEWIDQLQFDQLRPGALVGDAVAALDRIESAQWCGACLCPTLAPTDAPRCVQGAPCAAGHFACAECLGVYVGVPGVGVVLPASGAWQLKCYMCPLPIDMTLLAPCLTRPQCLAYQRRLADATHVQAQTDAVARAQVPLVDEHTHALDESQNLRCPQCDAVFLDFDGCLSVHCLRCDRHFCAACLEFHGPSGKTHAHVKICARNPSQELYASTDAWTAMALGHRAAQGELAWSALPPAIQLALGQHPSALAVHSVIAAASQAKRMEMN